MSIASTTFVFPGVMPHQQGSLQPPLDWNMSVMVKGLFVFSSTVADGVGWAFGVPVVVFVGATGIV
jgi:hypothetical protein